MRRFFALLILALLALGIWLVTRPDPRYTVEEWLALGRYGRYDAIILDIAQKHDIDPLLIKAVIWQESRFRPDKTGKVGERGLMQIGEAAAQDWVKANGVESFQPTDLFSPRTNIEIGAWYLRRAIRSWEEKESALPFALAEYNAGRRHVRRWISEASATSEAISSEEFRALISYPSTRAYISAIERRYDQYRADSSRQ